MPVLLLVEDLKVRSLDVDFHEVSWRLADTTEDVLDYTFQVFRSESVEGPYAPLSVPFPDRYIFVDNALLVGDRWRQYHYKLRLTHVPSGNTQDIGPASKVPEADLLTTEIRRHVNLLFKEFAARRCWVLPARTFGQRCSSCWNSKLKERRRSGCVLCFDTSFVRGYLSPIESYIQIDPSGKSEQNTSLGAQQQVNTTARLSYYPPLKPRDIIVEPENRRWRIVQVNQTEHLRAPVHQEVQMHEVPPKDIEFAIPINLDEALRDLSFSSLRNFTNPQNLEAFLDEELPGILALYPSRPRE